jgi:hypothetical protein
VVPVNTLEPVAVVAAVLEEPRRGWLVDAMVSCTKATDGHPTRLW